MNLTHWFIDENGIKHTLAEVGADNIELHGHIYWVEVYLLAPPDAETGREVLGQYVLRRGGGDGVAVSPQEVGL